MPAEHTASSPAPPQPGPTSDPLASTPVGERARDLVPEVLLTVLGMIQALAFELWWSRLEHAGHLWGGGIEAWIGWLQMGAVLQGILLVWLLYVSLVLRLRWVPRVRDAVLPFAIGIGEFVTIELSTPARLAAWLAANAAVFAVSAATSFATFRTASRDPENRAFFAGLGMGLGRTFLPPALFVAMLLLLAGVVSVTEPASAIGLGAVASANLALGVQLLLLAHYWRVSIAPGPRRPKQAPSRIEDADPEHASEGPAARDGASRPMGAAPGAPRPTAPTPRDG